MPEKTRRLYWDSCVFLSYIEGHIDRSPHIEAFLEKADEGSVSIVTSTVSIVEVAFAKQEKDQKRLDDAVDSRINELWSASSPVRLVEYNEAIARRAKQLIRDAMAEGKSLRPMDAVHIATAAALEIEELHTYDERMQKHADLAQLSIAEPLTEQLTLALGAPGVALLAAGDPPEEETKGEVAEVAEAATVEGGPTADVATKENTSMTAEAEAAPAGPPEAEPILTNGAAENVAAAEPPPATGAESPPAPAPEAGTGPEETTRPQL